MTTDEMIALAKEKLGRDITEEEARDYLDGKLPLPDEALGVGKRRSFLSRLVLFFPSHQSLPSLWTECR